MNALGIYCHIPFCVKKCAYCDFPSFSISSDDEIKRYFNALQKEIKTFAIKNKGEKLPLVDTIYFGGGTPSSVPAEYVRETMGLIHEVFSISRSVEQTIEINPGTLSFEKVRVLKEAGFNRVSMGLQAWQDVLLKSLGRIHRQSDFITSMGLLKEAGFENISVDVMYGLPGQSVKDVVETLEALMAFSPTHLSCYSLILEEGTAMTKREAQGEIVLPDEDVEREMHWEIDGFLRSQGYEHYEISSFGKPGYESRHNLKYWEEIPYCGFGCGAHGFYNGVRYGNTGNLSDYCRLVENDENPGVMDAPLTKSQLMSEWLFLGLRKLKGIDDAAFQQRFGKSFFLIYENAINSLISQGLLVREGSILRLTDRGQDFGNQVFMAFL
ncbi:MAG TPA: radical SAM family heme chaperone HemW [Acetobacterium sp.]